MASEDVSHPAFKSTPITTVFYSPSVKTDEIRLGPVKCQIFLSKCPTLFQTSADTKNRSSPQVNAMLGLKFVQYAIPGKKFKQKAKKEDS